MNLNTKPGQNLLLAFASLLFLVSCSKGSGGSGSTPKPAPTISSISVNSGPYNTEVVIMGTGFSSTSTDDKVFFNGKAAEISSATSTQLIVAVPLAAGTGNITISIDNGVAVTGPNFTYQATEVVTTFAGNSSAGSNNGLGTMATFYEPDGLAMDTKGNLFVADQYNNLIREITPQGLVSTLAGNGSQGYADGLGMAAAFNHPTGVAVDAAGNVYVADRGNNIIRMITSSGVVSTFAGSGIVNRNDGTGTSASFNSPTGIVVNATGDLFVTDSYNGLIREITSTGVVTTFAGGPHLGFSDGIGTNALFETPTAIAIDNNGNLYITDIQNSSIRKITPSAVVTTIAGGVQGLVNGLGSAAEFNEPQGITADNNGNIYVGDTGNALIRKITSGGVVTTFAGTSQGFADGPIATAAFSGPEGLVFDSNGNLFIADAGARIREVTFQ